MSVLWAYSYWAAGNFPALPTGSLPAVKVTNKVNPSCKLCHLSSYNLVSDTLQITSSQGTQKAQVPASSRDSSQSIPSLLTDLQRSTQGIFSHLSAKCSVTTTTSQFLASFSLQPVSSFLTSQKGYLHALWCWAGCLQAMQLVQE